MDVYQIIAFFFTISLYKNCRLFVDLKAAAFFINYFPFVFMMSFRITRVYIRFCKKLALGFKILFFTTVIPSILQLAVYFHFLFDCFWFFYLHLLLNAIVFVSIPYYSWLFYKKGTCDIVTNKNLSIITLNIICLLIIFVFFGSEILAFVIVYILTDKLHAKVKQIFIKKRIKKHVNASEDLTKRELQKLNCFLKDHIDEVESKFSEKTKER
jgi:hypothetical protein